MCHSIYTYIQKYQMHNFIANRQQCLYICMHLLSIWRKKRLTGKKRSQKANLTTFARLSGTPSPRRKLFTINNFSEFVLGCLKVNRRYILRFGFQRWEHQIKERKWMRDIVGWAGFIYNSWLAENENWPFFIPPVVVKEVPVTMRAMSPGQWMFPWQQSLFFSLLLICEDVLQRIYGL